MLPLAQALRLTRQSAVAFVGAGGKTSGLVSVARALAPCFAAATSHLGDWQATFADRHIVWPAHHDEAPAGLAFAGGIVLVTGQPDTQPHRLCGLRLDQAAVLCATARARGWPVFIEADGSRRRPLKAPAAHEPPIPPDVDLVVVVAGLTALGHPLTEEHVHRPERFAALADCALGSRLTPDLVARVLTHPDGGLKNVPAGARCVLLLNQADTPTLRATASHLAERLLARVDAIVIASLAPDGPGPAAPPLAAGPVFAVHESVAGTLLAAGSSSRLGRPKQLLDYHGRPFVRAAAETALAAGLSPVQVIVGDHADDVAAALAGLSVSLILNPAWPEGQASSIRAGIAVLPSRAGATVFLLADQPHLPADLLRALVEAHAEGLHPFVAPVVGGRRTSPMLFDRATFSALLALRGDTGGRAVLAAASSQNDDHTGLHLVPWADARILLDVDTEEDYRQLLATTP